MNITSKEKHIENIVNTINKLFFLLEVISTVNIKGPYKYQYYYYTIDPKNDVMNSFDTVINYHDTSTPLNILIYYLVYGYFNDIQFLDKAQIKSLSKDST